MKKLMLKKIELIKEIELKDEFDLEMKNLNNSQFFLEIKNYF
jgi:hypothetical protein